MQVKGGEGWARTTDGLHWRSIFRPIVLSCQFLLLHPLWVNLIECKQQFKIPFEIELQ